MSKEREKTTSKDLTKLLQEINEKGGTVYSWYNFDSHVIKAELKIKRVRKDRNEIVLTSSANSLPYLKQMISGTGTINIYAPDTFLIFTSEFKELSKDGVLTISLPSNYSIYERRQSERVSPYSDISVNFKLNNREIKKSCFDIGDGGMSIVFAKNERFELKEDDFVDSIEIDFGHRKLSVEKCRVAGILKLKPFMIEKCPYGGRRVSFEFKEISSESADFIKMFIQEHQKLAKKLVSN